MVKSKPKICFVSQNIYPLLKENSQADFMGGAELQQLLIGKALAARGYEISFITKNHGQPDATEINSFRVISTFKSNEGLRGVRFIHPRLTRIWQALKKTNADIYYVRCASFILAPVVLYAKLHQKKVVYCGANDVDFDPKRLRLPVHFRDKTMYYWGLKRCDAVIVQNRVQQELLKKHFKMAGQLIHNGLPKADVSSDGENILWVATFKKQKNPQLFLDLAKKFPNEKFIMIGGNVNRSNGREQTISKRAAKISNLDYKGFLPFKEVEKHFLQAKLFVNTSSYEGFPNTFLQAWRRGVPVITFIDPDNLIQTHKLGIVASDTNDMEEKITDYLKKPTRFSAKKIKQSFNINFTIDKIADQYEQLFDSIQP